jgi:hypothetical protein
VKFVIMPTGAPFPKLELGTLDRGGALACFIPAGIEWKQINYGQGEGQVEIGGCEWGFYYTSRYKCSSLAAGWGIVVQLEVGDFSANAALELVQRIAELISCGAPFEIMLRGTAEP